MIALNRQANFPFLDPNFSKFHQFFRNQNNFYKNFQDGIYHSEDPKEDETVVQTSKNVRFSREK